MADSELDAMATVYGALDPLDGPARERVLRWAAAKFEVAGGLAFPDFRPRHTVDEEGGTDPAEFREIGDLIHAAQPDTGPTRALVAAYWFQEVQAQDGWTGADINSALKNMGTGLANVTKTLDSLRAKKPALVMQVGKSGRSRQARKTYKLTTAGLRDVKQMIASGSQAEAA